MPNETDPGLRASLFLGPSLLGGHGGPKGKPRLGGRLADVHSPLVKRGKQALGWNPGKPRPMYFHP